MSKAAANRKIGVFFVVILPRYLFQYEFSGRTTLSGGVLKKEMTTDLFSHQAWLRLGVIWL
jgi:hypothetical protein